MLSWLMLWTPALSWRSRRLFLQVLGLAALSCRGRGCPRARRGGTRAAGLRAELQTLLDASDFWGTLLLTREGSTVFSAARGLADGERREIRLDDRFVVGSISKQIAAALVLREFESGTLQLDEPVGSYLSELEQSWAGSVTIHHLLTHTHGIQAVDEPLAFELGSRFEYSQLGYNLLARVLEAIKKKGFREICSELFSEFRLGGSFHPADLQDARLVRGFERWDEGEFLQAKDSFKNYAAAGSLISTAADLARWNELLHSGKIVAQSTFERMRSRYATREHPIFGKVEYGYGLLFRAAERDLQIGALGYAPGFASASYYYPRSGLNLVVLSNRVDLSGGFKRGFGVHVQAMQMAKAAV